MKTTSANSPDAIEITYHEENGYLYPDLKPSPQMHYRIGKYGGLYGNYAQAKEMVRSITDHLAVERGLDEVLKARGGLR